MAQRQTHLAMAALAAVAMLGPSNVSTADDDLTISDQTIVELNTGSNIDDINDSFGSWTIASIEAHNLYLLGVPEGMEPEDFEELLLEDPRVQDAEANDDAMVPTAVGGDTQPLFFQVTHDDFEDQYVPQLLNLSNAHVYTTGDGIVVAVVDTGVDYTHGLLYQNIVPGLDLVDDDLDPMDEGNGIDDDEDGWIDEQVGHGTLVAGLVVLVAPDAMIMPVRVLDSDGNSDLFRVTAGVYHAVDFGADVICLGLSTHNNNHILRDAVEYAVAQGTVVLAAVGNDDSQNPTPIPAGMDVVIGVAATDAQDIRAEFSNYGDYVGLSAPGLDLVSAIPGGGYGLASGTSLSTAIASGVIALLMSDWPEASVLQLMTEVTSTSVDIDGLNPEYAGLLGAGRVSMATPPQPAGFGFDTGLLNVRTNGRSDGAGSFDPFGFVGTKR